MNLVPYFINYLDPTSFPNKGSIGGVLDPRVWASAHILYPTALKIYEYSPFLSDGSSSEWLQVLGANLRNLPDVLVVLFRGPAFGTSDSYIGCYWVWGLVPTWRLIKGIVISLGLVVWVSSHSLLVSFNFVHQAVFVLVALISFSMNTTRHAQRSMKSRLLVLATSTLLTNTAPRHTVPLTVNLSASPGPLHPSYLHSHCHYEAQFGKSISSQQVQLMFTLAMHFYQLASRVPNRPCFQRTWPTGGFFCPM